MNISFEENTFVLTLRLDGRISCGCCGRISRMKIYCGFSIFSFFPGTSLNDMEGIVRVNGCTILYGLLRGHLASVTGAFPSGPYVLPTVNMLEVVKRIEESRR